jgi:hypothetical protein
MRVEIDVGPAITLTCLRCGKGGLNSRMELNPPDNP